MSKRPEQKCSGDGSRRARSGASHRKRLLARTERRRAKRDPECPPGYRRFLRHST